MKIISIVSTSDAQIWVEDFGEEINEMDVIKRFKEINDSNSDSFETKQFAFIVEGDIIKHNIKNLEIIKIQK